MPDDTVTQTTPLRRSKEGVAPASTPVLRGRGISRREFLKMAGAGLAGVALVGVLGYGGGWLMEKISEQQDRLLRSIAGQVTHGDLDDGEPYESLEARLAAGERLYLTCTPICYLAQRALHRAGFRSRLVLTMTRQEYNGDDGHTMIEVHNGQRWVVYDLDGNRQPIDAQGRGTSVVELVEAWPRRWRMLASDPILEESAYNDPVQAAWATNPEAWYDRVLGVPLIQRFYGAPLEHPPGSDGDLYLFHDWGERRRIEAYSPTYRWTDQWTWQNLVEGRLA